MLVSSKDKKGKEQRTIEFVPIYLKDRVEKDMESARNYLMEERGLREPKILIKKIKIDTLFKVDGFYMWLSGRTDFIKRGYENFKKSSEIYSETERR